jgi:isoleucyl-tRNA synthetase
MSTLGYRQRRDLWKQWFPADLVSESFPGQFRNWFYSLLTMSTILERRAPFRNVFSYGTLLAEDGRAMHKSWGNAIEFNEAADKIVAYLVTGGYLARPAPKAGTNGDKVKRDPATLWTQSSGTVLPLSGQSGMEGHPVRR